QGFNVHQNEHAFGHTGDACDVAHVHRHVHLGRWADLLRLERQHVGNRIHHRAHHASMHVKHNHHGEVVVRNRAAVELYAKVHHGHDHPAQVHHALDEA